MPRAGLLCVFVLALLTSLVTCVPLTAQVTAASSISPRQTIKFSAKPVQWVKDESFRPPAVARPRTTVLTPNVANEGNALYPRSLKKVRDAFRNAGSKVKQSFQTAGNKMKQGFQTAGKWVKKHGLKVAKLGLRAISTIQKIGSHVAKFIPVVGTALSHGLTAASMGTNAAANAIPVKLTGNLAKADRIMGHIRNPLGLVAKKGAPAVRRTAPRAAARVAGGRGSQARVPARRPNAGSSRASSAGRSAARRPAVRSPTRAARSSQRRNTPNARRPVGRSAARRPGPQRVAARPATRGATQPRQVIALRRAAHPPRRPAPPPRRAASPPRRAAAAPPRQPAPPPRRAPPPPPRRIAPSPPRRAAPPRGKRRP